MRTALTKLWLISAFWATTSFAGFSPHGMCSQEPVLPNLPRANCRLPLCPSGSDCTAPVIDRASARIEYEEPSIQWESSCPDSGMTGACWHFRSGFTLYLEATAALGISAVGANLSFESNGRRYLKKYWGNPPKDANGTSRMHAVIDTYAPPGGAFSYSVFELCARDAIGNEACVLPLNGTPASAMARN